MNFYFQSTMADRKETFPKIKGAQIKQLPIHLVDFHDDAEKLNHNNLVSLVTQMLSLHKELSEAKTPQDKNFLQRQIEQTDRKIDQLVYELYGLSQEEIAIVEGE